MKNAIQTNGLVHSYEGKELVINELNLCVPEGSIFGFLGPNGAGKTTTLRLLLGLIKIQSGEVKIFDQSLASHRIEILKRVGSLIESPSIYGHLTARENLLIWQKIYQCPLARIDEVLQWVGLSGTGKKKAGKFSLGMKQRLSIAISLLHSPQLLILDEPTNGLDPQGILEMRELLKELNSKHGITILVSSHLLSEIERLVTHVAIIDKGKLKFQGTLQALTSVQRQSEFLIFDTSDNIQALHLIGKLGMEGYIDNGKIHTSLMSRQQIATANHLIISNGIELYECATGRNDLESIFMNLIQHES
jgi:ABC-2 type transport system ATP-binding protein